MLVHDGCGLFPFRHKQAAVRCGCTRPLPIVGEPHGMGLRYVPVPPVLGEPLGQQPLWSARSMIPVHSAAHPEASLKALLAQPRTGTSVLWSEAFNSPRRAGSWRRPHSESGWVNCACAAG